MDHNFNIFDLRELLLNFPSHSIPNALYLLVDHLCEIRDGSDISMSHGNIGIHLVDDCIEIVDIEAGKVLATLYLTIH